MVGCAPNTRASLHDNAAINKRIYVDILLDIEKTIRSCKSPTSLICDPHYLSQKSLFLPFFIKKINLRLSMRKALEQQSPDQFLRYCVTRNYQDTINQLHAIADHIARYLPPHFDVDHERLKPGLAWQCCQHGNLKVMRIQWCCQNQPVLHFGLILVWLVKQCI